MHMKRAIELSQQKMSENAGGPFGAVIVKENKVIAEGWNCVTSRCDPTAHAEVEAIRKACEHLENFNLEGCTIYTSCEPCPMCLSAIYWARIDKIYYANTREDAARISFDDDFIYNQIPLSPSERAIPMEQVERDLAQEVFQSWQDKTDKISY